MISSCTWLCLSAVVIIIQEGGLYGVVLLPIGVQRNKFVSLAWPYQRWTQRLKHVSGKSGILRTRTERLSSMHIIPSSAAL